MLAKYICSIVLLGAALAVSDPARGSDDMAGDASTRPADGTTAVPSLVDSQYAVYARRAADIEKNRSTSGGQSIALPVDADLDAIKIAAWAYRGTGNQTWRELVAGRTTDPALSGDERARWLLAQAYAAEIAQDPPRPLAGRQWIDQALAAAQSSAARLRCIEYLSLRLTLADRVEEALSVVASVEGQFDEAEQRELAAILGRIDEYARARASAAETEAKQLAIRRLRGQIETLRLRLAEAERAGRSSADLQSIRELIDQSQRELNALVGP